MPQTAKETAETIYEWAVTHGVFLHSDAQPAAVQVPLARALTHTPHDDLLMAERVLGKAEVTGVLFDEANKTVTILTKGKIGSRSGKGLPEVDGGIEINYIGGAYPTASPGPLPPSPPGHPHAYIHDGRVACGSSITAATEFGAGTFGCLVRNRDGVLCGLTNNHVTAGCNHMDVGMHILSPSPFDAKANGPAPLAIGKHSEFVPLQSGNPAVMALQELDAAIFTINDDNLVSSMQGVGIYDTPPVFGPIAPKMRVKKVGRTTEETKGTVLGQWAKWVPIPYNHKKFSSTVYFHKVFGVLGDGDDQVTPVSGAHFSTSGDSGSLVVTERGDIAVGLVFASYNNVSLVMPLDPVMQTMGLTLVSGHNV